MGIESKLLEALHHTVFRPDGHVSAAPERAHASEHLWWHINVGLKSRLKQGMLSDEGRVYVEFLKVGVKVFHNCFFVF